MAPRKKQTPEEQTPIGKQLEKQTSEELSNLPPPPPGSDQAHDTSVIVAVDEGFEPGPSGKAQAIGVKKILLSCPLTVDEQLDRGLQLAKTFAGIKEEELRQKEIKDEMKAIMSKLEKEQSDLAIAVETGEEKRLVDVQYNLLGDGETISEVRLDTGKPINTRPATDFERQGKLFNDEPIFPED